jgi:integral membrane protein
MLQLFRIVSYLEGISYLLLLFVGVPLKHFGGNEIIVKMLGMPHGILFIGYILLAFFIKPFFNWDKKTFYSILAASVIPFGTFYADQKFLKNKTSNLT